MLNQLKEISIDEYYNLPTLRIITTLGSKTNEVEYPNPEPGKTYRNPLVLPTSSRTVNLTTIIGVEKEKVPYFEYAFPPKIKRLHIEERTVYVKAQ